MVTEKIQDFTRRLSQCNKGEMIVITYEILFCYLEDAKEAIASENREDYKMALRQSTRTLDELIGALDFSYEISKNLYRLYVFCKNELAKAMYEGKCERILQTEEILKPLYHSFVEAAKQDTSGPLMRNTQQVYAGITYGKNDIKDYMETDHQRGFLA